MEEKIINLARFLISAIGTVVGAWFTVGLYNLIVCKGAFIGFRLFIYPFLEQNGVTNFEAPLTFEWQPWIITILFFMCLFWRSAVPVIRRYIPSNRESFVFYVSVLALGRCVYFMNRPAWGNLRLACSQEAVLLIIIFMDYLLKQIGDKKEYTFRQAVIRGMFVVQGILIASLFYFATLYLPHIYRSSSDYKQSNLNLREGNLIEEINTGGGILIGRSALVVASELKLNPENVLTDNFINCFDYAGTWDNIMKSENNLIVDEASYNLFMSVFGTDNILQKYNDPYLINAGNISFYLFRLRDT